MAVSQQEDRFLIATTVALMALIFFVDVSVPLGVASAVAYVAVVMLSLRSPKKRFTWFVAIGSSALTVAGYWLSPNGGILWMVVANRVIALFAIWVTALLSLHHKRVEEDLRNEKNTIELFYETSLAAIEYPAAETLLRAALDRVCAFTGWQLGHVLCKDENDQWSSSDLWHCDDFECFGDFLKSSDQLTSTADNTILGIVLSSQAPVSVTDVTRDLNFICADPGTPLGVRGALGFPLFVRGEIAYVLTFFSPDRIEPGQRLLENISYVAIQTGNAIEHKLAQKDLYHHGQAIEQSLDGIAITDLFGTLQFVNTAFAEIHGYTVEQLRGLSTKVLHTPEQLAEDVLPFVAEVREKGGFLGDVARKKSDGSTFPTRTSASLLRNEAGDPIGILEIVRDVSESIELEAQLRQAQKLESIGRLAGGIAHDFNTILGAIIGNCEVVEERVAADPELQMSVEQIHKSAERGAALTSKLLTFSRDTIVEPVVLNMNQLIEDLEPMLRRIITEDIEFVCDLNPELGRIKADPGLLEQVLMNLVVNASDAMPEGGCLRIETSNCALGAQRAEGLRELSPGSYVIVSVSDTGFGMSEEIRGRIFEPFFSTKEVGKGTGLGLSIVYGIVKRSGGGIVVDSAPEQGAHFRIYIPEVAEEVAETVEPAYLTPVSVEGTESILLVEDDESLRSVLSRVLTRHGYEVLCAESPAEALEIGASFSGELNLLVTDVLMPGMNGLELADAMFQAHQSLRVLYMSGYTEEVLNDRAGSIDGSNFLHKPFGSEVFTRKVREVLDFTP